MGAEVMEMAGKLKSKWLSEDQIKVIKGFGRRFGITRMSSGTWDGEFVSWDLE